MLIPELESFMMGRGLAGDLMDFLRRTWDQAGQGETNMYEQLQQFMQQGGLEHATRAQARRFKRWLSQRKGRLTLFRRKPQPTPQGKTGRDTDDIYWTALTISLLLHGGDMLTNLAVIQLGVITTYVAQRTHRCTDYSANWQGCPARP